jgi:hypothetical protein
VTRAIQEKAITDKKLRGTGISVPLNFAYADWFKNAGIKTQKRQRGRMNLQTGINTLVWKTIIYCTING